MRDVLSRYFQAWLDGDIEVVRQTFAEDAVYSECYGPEYRGLSQILAWFEDWNQKGRVLEWRIKRLIEAERTVVAEWYFRCDYAGSIEGFDGVTIADFGTDDRIVRLLEFQSKAEHTFPYDRQPEGA